VNTAAMGESIGERALDASPDRSPQFNSSPRLIRDGERKESNLPLPIMVV
jgi:hypothetical protein